MAQCEKQVALNETYTEAYTGTGTEGWKKGEKTIHRIKVKRHLLMQGEEGGLFEGISAMEAMLSCGSSLLAQVEVESKEAQEAFLMEKDR